VAKISAEFPGVKVDTLRAYLSSFDPAALAQDISKNGGNLTINIDGKDVVLVHKTHMWFSVKDRYGD
jgi:hypothetical protein